MGNFINGAFTILGKFFFFYMLFGIVWTFYNEHVYGQDNIGLYSTKIGTIIALIIVLAIEIYGLVNRVTSKGEGENE